MFIVIGLLGASAVSQAFLTQQQDGAWRNIKLLHSKRTDVEKQLRQTTEASAYLGRYSLQNYELWVDYYPFDHCRPKYGKVGEWNVPEWTVTEITYIPGETLPFNNLKLDLRQFKKVHESPHVPDMLSYINEGKGVDYTLDSDGKTLHSIRYFPSIRDQRLRCEKMPDE